MRIQKVRRYYEAGQFSGESTLRIVLNHSALENWKSRTPQVSIGSLSGSTLHPTLSEACSRDLASSRIPLDDTKSRKCCRLGAGTFCQCQSEI
jgi:hypothetical protein